MPYENLILIILNNKDVYGSPFLFRLYFQIPSYSLSSSHCPTGESTGYGKILGLFINEQKMYICPALLPWFTIIL